MHPHDYYLGRLDRQRADIQSALADLMDSRRAGWRVLQAELALDSVVRSYVREMQDAPGSAIAQHVAICTCFT